MMALYTHPWKILVEIGARADSTYVDVDSRGDLQRLHWGVGSASRIAYFGVGVWGVSGRRGLLLACFS